jgi:hypothetical protein
MGMTFAGVRKIILSFPGVVEGSSYGTPGFKIGKKFLSRLKENGQDLVVRVGMDEREMLMQMRPETFHITDHYRDYPAMLVRLKNIDAATLRRLLEQSWRERAPARLVKAFDEKHGKPRKKKK